MKDKYLVSKDNGQLQISYAEYRALMDKLEEAQHIRQVKSKVLSYLQRYIEGQSIQQDSGVKAPQEAPKETVEPAASVEQARPEKVAVEFPPEKPEGHAAVPSQEEPSANRSKTKAEVPAIKKEIEIHFNAQDDSGRLLNVFKQYYTCLNESCGGIVRVTMKDGICSLWNYDEWEEFAFIDIYEGDLRFAVDPRYTDELSALSFCEVPRLLASRRDLISIHVGDLNKTMLSVLTKAFEEIGLTAG